MNVEYLKALERIATSYLDLVENISKNRKLEIENSQIFGTYRKKLGGFEDKNQLELFLAKESEIKYERSLNFE